MRAWVRRTTELQRELAAIADADPRWWLLAAGVAFAETRAPDEIYLACGTEPDADTFMAFRSPPPHDLVRDAIARATAARAALRELHDTLPDQPLAVTIDHASPTETRPSDLDVAAFAIGATCLTARLDDPTLATQLADALDRTALPFGSASRAARVSDHPAPWSGPPPFVCVSIGDEPLETARHGHRRAWTKRGGPWLGLGRANGLAIVSTCHLIIDGYGHACIAARIAELAGPVAAIAPPPLVPRLPVVDGAVPLTITWRELPSPTPRVLPLAYRLGCILHRHANQPAARFSPTLQIPVARGAKHDPVRLRRRVISATTSVRFANGVPEPFEHFEARVRDVFKREAAAAGLASRLLAAARAVPVPVAWKRKGISAKRPPWLESFAAVIGGRALMSRIALDVRAPALCAVSSPSRLATPADPIGGCVITLIDDGARAAISVCGSGFAGTAASGVALLDELLAQ